MFEQDFSLCCRAQGDVVSKFQPDIHGLSRALAHVVHSLPAQPILADALVCSLAA
jgi:hypothetical protein